MKPKFAFVLFTLLATLVLGACSSTPEPVTVEIDMNEYSFEPNDLKFEVGQEVTLILTNSGEKDHELMIGNAVKNEDGLPAEFRFDFFREGGVVPDVSGVGMLMAHAEEDGHDDAEMDMADDDSMDMEDDHSDDEMDMADEESMDAEDDHADDEMDMSSDDSMDMESGDLHGDTPLMVMIPVSNDTTVVTFTVTEDMVGRWEMACFEENGAHYLAGMTGNVIVVP